MKSIKRFVFVLCVLSLGATPVQGAPTFDGQATIKTAQWAIPSAVLEWEAHQLFEEEGIYSFTGRSPVPFTVLSVGWLATDHIADPAEFQIEIRTRRDEELWTEWVHIPGDIDPDDSPSGLFWARSHSIYSDLHTEFEIRVRPPVGVLLNFVRVSVADTSIRLKATDLFEEPEHLKAATVNSALGALPRPPYYSPQ